MKALTVFVVAFVASVLAGCHGGGTPSPSSLETFATLDAQVASTTLASDAGGNVYMLVREHDAAGGLVPRLLKITPSGVVTRIPVALTNPGAVATDATGNVYVGDSPSCATSPCTFPAATVQRIGPDGTVTALPVKGSSDQTSSLFLSVSGLAVDAAGDIFIADRDQQTIRRLGPGGDLTTYAGQPVPGGAEVDGIGMSAAFAGPGGIALDAQGNLYVADARGETIRKITRERVVSTVAGGPFVVGGADGPAATARFTIPTQVVVAPSGNLYVADAGNSLIRKIAPDGTVSTIAGTRGQRGYAPGPLPGVIDIPFGIALVQRDLVFAISNEAVTRTSSVPLILVAVRNVP
jgi:sugar lactone lactonase YvrE